MATQKFKVDPGSTTDALVDNVTVETQTGDIAYAEIVGKDGVSTAHAVQATAAGALVVDGSGVTQPVSGTVTVSLPTGASTSAKQDTGNTSLASIDGKITAVNTGAVTVAASALPTGASTAANQATGNTSLSDLDTNLGAKADASATTDTGTFSLIALIKRLTSKIPALGSAASASSLPVVIASDQGAVAVTANAGTNLNTSALALDATLTGGTQRNKITDGTNNAAVMAASTAAVGTDPALVVAISPNNTAKVSQATASNLNATVVGTGTFVTQSTLAAETTKVIGVTRSADGAGNLLTSTGNAIDVNLKTSAVSVNTTEVAPTTILNGKTTVTTAGTRVTLAASTACKSVTIKALATNTGTIYVGSSTVAAANGFQLAASDTVTLDIANLNTVNLDSSVNGEGVTYAGVN